MLESTGGLTHLTGREWAQVLGMSAFFLGLIAAGGMLARYGTKGGDDWAQGPDGWPGWDGYRADDLDAQGKPGDNAHGSIQPPVFGTGEVGLANGGRHTPAVPAPGAENSPGAGCDSPGGGK